MKTEFYKSLKEKLDDHSDFPSVYMFKFIIPADNHKLALVEALFDDNAIVTTRQSKTNKFISITAKEMMTSSDQIIKVHQAAEKIEGIIQL